MNGPVRHKCLSVIGKLMYFSNADMIQALISATNISRYFSRTFGFRDWVFIVRSPYRQFECFFLGG